MAGATVDTACGYEPIASNAADYRIFVGMVRKYMPGI